MQMQKKYATGRPDQKDLNENLAATQGLAHMITECNRLFEVRHIHTHIFFLLAFSIIPTVEYKLFYFPSDST